MFHLHHNFTVKTGKDNIHPLPDKFLYRPTDKNLLITGKHFIGQPVGICTLGEAWSRKRYKTGKSVY